MFKTPSEQYKALRRGDADFFFSPDGIKFVPRAGIEISKLCPPNMRLSIERAIADGYLVPVAYMRDVEYTMELLRR